MNDRTFMTLMKLLPKSALSSAVGMATRAPAPTRLHRFAMKAFAQRYRVAMNEAEHSFDGYSTFAEFFTRRLKPGLRPIVEGERVVASPVDGAVSQVGYAEKGECIQAKGICFPLEKLLADREQAEAFEGGAFATIYLSPRDYHRIHSPLAGEILGYSYVPGEFWPVNPATVRSKEALFCVNERLITYLKTPVGKLALVAVGATCVARIHASYDAILTHTGDPGKVHWYPRPLAIKKGDEVGMFEMGSTVILVFEKNRVKWDSFLQAEAVLRLGQRIGEGT
jgi:phosphatidylserine decarboxylase